MAIAVPIFMGQLQKARVARDEANIRAVKEAAVVAILNDETYDLSKDDPLYVSGCVLSNGDLTITKITRSDTGFVASKAGNIQYSDSGTTANIFVKIEITDLSVDVD